MYDLLIKNATIIDGTGKERYKANVSTFQGIIAWIGPEEPRAKEIIDGSGCILTPGFVDVHAHSELEMLRDKEMKAKLQMGITTDISGNCGIGVFPKGSDDSAIKGLSDEVLGPFGKMDWSDITTFREKVLLQGVGCNVAFLQAHAPLRAFAMGNDCNREASDAETQVMCRELEKSCKGGALGLSSGLYYAPCVYAERKELVALLSTCAKCGGTFAVHHRCEGDDVINSLEEVLSLAKETGVKLEVSHLKAIGKKNQDKVDTLLTMLENARRDGVDVHFDQYPYTYGSTSLFSLLPPAFLRLSRIEQRFALSIDNEREDIKKAMLDPKGWDSIYELVGPDDIKICELESNSEYEGLSLRQIANARNITDPLDALLDILGEETGSAVMIDVTESEANLIKILSHPLMCFGTDALYSSPNPHPRSHSSAIELIAHYGLEKRVMSLEELIRKMSGEGASRFGFTDRGTIEEGKYADMVLFNPAKLKPTAELGKPFVKNEGLTLVTVNGTVAIRDGLPTGAIKGMLL